MGKSKNQTETNDSAPVVVPATPQGSLFKRKSAVMVPTLKLVEDKPVYVQITQPIQVKQSLVKGDDGVDRMKDISIASIVNLETGELMSFVVGKALEQNLKDYQGGNNKYVGLSFEITKHSSAPGKRWKAYSLFEIDPDEKGEA